VPHTDIPPGVPGIRGLFRVRPETAGPITDLAQQLVAERGYTAAPSGAHVASR
jgi:hypothetical protein